MVMKSYDWQVVCNQAPPGRTYLYLIDDYNRKRMLRTDPMSFSVVDIPEGHQIQSVVYDPTLHQWSDQVWMMKRALTDPLRSPLSINEMHPKSWKYGVHQPVNYRQLAPELADYCQRMGFTHVKVFGLLEHSHQTGRGYQVANFFAPYHDNGQCEDLKYFVDHLHQHDIGVIIDWIPTHFHRYHVSNSFPSSMDGFDGTNLHSSHASRWGTLYFDYSKEETYRLLFASALYFLDEIHMIRRDLKGISAAIAFLREMNEAIHRYYPGVLSIAERWFSI